MKTIAKINPDQEYENAISVLQTTGKKLLDSQSFTTLDTLIQNLITVAHVLIECGDLRRGKKNSKTKFSSQGRKLCYKIY